MKKEPVILDHIGLLVEDRDKMVDFFKHMPFCKKEWKLEECDFKQEDLRVGKGYRIKTAFGYLGDLGVEIIEPIPEYSEGCYMLEWIGKHGPGFHHVAYHYEDVELYQKKVEELTEAGMIIVLEGETLSQEGTPDEVRVLVHYFADPATDSVLEINCFL